MSVQPTSHAAYDEIRPELASRELLVLAALRRYEQHHRAWPTAYELFEFMKRLQLATDLNSVRPRLTALRAKEQVFNPSVKRHCGVTGKRAFTWAITPS